MKNFLAYYLPATIWGILILFLSSIPDVPVQIQNDYYFDKILHFAEYFIFGYLVTRIFVLKMGNKSKQKAIAYSFLLCILFGAADEWHQVLVPERIASSKDFLANLFGIAISQIVLIKFSKLYKFNPEKN